MDKFLFRIDFYYDDMPNTCICVSDSEENALKFISEVERFDKEYMKNISIQKLSELDGYEIRLIKK